MPKQQRMRSGAAVNLATVGAGVKLGCDPVLPDNTLSFFLVSVHGKETYFPLSSRLLLRVTMFLLRSITCQIPAQNNTNIWKFGTGNKSVPTIYPGQTVCPAIHSVCLHRYDTSL